MDRLHFKEKIQEEQKKILEEYLDSYDEPLMGEMAEAVERIQETWNARMVLYGLLPEKEAQESYKGLHDGSSMIALGNFLQDVNTRYRTEDSDWREVLGFWRLTWRWKTQTNDVKGHFYGMEWMYLYSPTPFTESWFRNVNSLKDAITPFERLKCEWVPLNKRELLEILRKIPESPNYCGNMFKYECLCEGLEWKTAFDNLQNPSPAEKERDWRRV